MWLTPNKNPGHQDLVELPWLTVLCVHCHTSLLGEASIVHTMPLGENNWKLSVPGLSCTLPYAPIPVADFNLYSFTMVNCNHESISFPEFCCSSKLLNLGAVSGISWITAYQRLSRCSPVSFTNFSILSFTFNFYFRTDFGIWHVKTPVKIVINQLTTCACVSTLCIYAVFQLFFFFF